MNSNPKHILIYNDRDKAYIDHCRYMNYSYEVGTTFDAVLRKFLIIERKDERDLIKLYVEEI